MIPERGKQNNNSNDHVTMVQRSMIFTTNSSHSFAYHFTDAVRQKTSSCENPLQKK